jgi:Flp pilus assembly protein TadD
MRLFLLLFFSLLLQAVHPVEGFAQNPKDFALANQLMQYGNYRDAADILRKLYQENPRNYPVFNRLVRCLTELKEYKEAIRITRAQLGGRMTDTPLAVSLGDLYYLMADTAQAMKTWKAALDANKASPQTWRDIAEAHANRKFYREAETVYLEARTVFKNPTLFMNELSNVYLVWGRYDRAAREWIQLVAQDPSKSAQLQRRMFRFEDDDYMDAFILELEEASKGYQTGSAQFYAFRDLLIWLYSEKKMFRKALAAARQLESVGSANGQSPVLSLGTRMAGTREYALAEEAFLFYETAGIPHLLKLSIEERARLYRSWGDEIRRKETGTLAEANDKYRKSLEMLERWKAAYGEHSLPPDLMLLHLQLKLEKFKDTAAVEADLEKVRKLPEMQTREGELYFLEGRVWQLKGDFMRARMAFNRSLKASPVSEPAERARYFLGLTDFYAHDFEFCLIQLRALERQSSSLFANDALKLRTWIQERNEADSTRNDLMLLAETLMKADRLDYAGASEKLLELMQQFPATPVAGYGLQAAADNLSALDIRQAHALLARNASWSASVPNAERLLWMRARFADLAAQQARKNGPVDLQATDALYFFGLTASAPEMSVPGRKEIMMMYEQVLSRFPAGFFAQQVRERLQELEQEAS